MARTAEALPVVFPTVVHALVDAAAKSPEREALALGGERLDYREYLRCVAGFSRELRALGLGGHRVALLMGNSIDMCIAMYAIHAAPAQAVPLNPAYTAPELLPMLEEAGVSAIVHDEALADLVRTLETGLRVEHLVAVGSARRLTAWRAGAGALDELPGPGDPATLQFTGGTTGRAKGACLSHYSLSVNVSQREAVFPTRDDVERMLCILPLFHCYAVSMGLHAMVYRRGALVILPRYRPGAVLAALARGARHHLCGQSHGIYRAAALPGFCRHGFFQLVYLLVRFGAPGGNGTGGMGTGHGYADTGGLRPVRGGAGDSVQPAARGRGNRPRSAFLCRARRCRWLTRCAARRCWKPVKRGEIRIAGPQVMSGYRNRPEETAMALRDGWLYTGDMGELDEDGYLYLRGRKKEMLLVSGYNVFPREIEETLHQHPDVKEAAVVGRTDAYRGELPVAFIVPAAGHDADAGSLRQYCEDNLAPYKLPAEFHIVESLPKTGVGKVDKVALARKISPHPAD